MGGKRKPRGQAAVRRPPQREPVRTARDRLVDALQDDGVEAARGVSARLLGEARTVEDRRELATVWSNAASRAYYAHEYAKALPLYDEAIAAFEAIPDPAGVAGLLDDRGCALWMMRRLDEGEASSREALRRHEALGNKRGIARALGNLSGLAFERGNIVGAAKLCRQAADLAHEMGDRRTEAMNLYSVARCEHEQGRSKEALRWAKKAQRLAREVNEQELTGNVTNLLAGFALEDGDLDGAQKRYEEALALFEGSRSDIHAGITIANLGNLHSDRGDDAIAIEHYGRAIALHVKTGDERSLAITLTSRGDTLTGLGRLAEAQADLDRALEITVRLGHKWREAFARRALGFLTEARGQKEQAKAEIAEAAMALEAGDDPIHTAGTLFELAMLQAELGDPAGAEALIARGAALEKPSKTPRPGHALRRALESLARGAVEAARSRDGGEALRAAAEKRLAAGEAMSKKSSDVRRAALRLRRMLERE